MKKLIAGAATALLVAAGAVVAFAAPASAHTGDLDVTAVCNTETGEYDFTATLDISQTGLEGSSKWRVGDSTFEGTPGNANGMDRGPVPSSGAGTITLGTFSLPGMTTGKGPWVYAYTTWSDDYKKGSDGQLLSNLAGDCAAPIPMDAAATLTVTPPTCEADGSAAWSGLAHATGGDLAQTVGMHSGTAYADDGHQFTPGQDEMLFLYTIDAQLDPNSEECYVPPTPSPATFAGETCTALGTFTVPQTDGVIYMITTDQAGGAKARIYAGNYFATDDRSATGEPFYGTVTIEAYDQETQGLLDGWAYTFGAPECILPTCAEVDAHVTLLDPAYIGNALTLTTTVDPLVQGSFQLPFTGDLADIGTVLDVQADPASEVGLWINVDGKWIVYEQGVYGGKLWSKTAFAGIPAGNGYKAMAPIEDYIALYGDLPATAWLLYGSGEAGSTAISSVTVGCTTYVFQAPEIPVKEPTVETVSTEWVGGEPTCENTEVEQTREVTAVTTTYDYVWEDGAYREVAHVGDPVVTSETQTVTWEGDDCPTPVTPTEPAAGDDALAVTGSGVNPLLPIGGALAVALGAAGILFGLVRRHLAKQ